MIIEELRKKLIELRCLDKAIPKKFTLTQEQMDELKADPRVLCFCTIEPREFYPQTFMGVKLEVEE